MGYSTEFEGHFDITPPLTTEQTAYLKQWAECRRMWRDENLAAKMDDPLRKAVGLPVGEDGEFFAGGLGFAGQDRDPSILEYNKPPRSQPGLWCQWVPSDDGTKLEWDGGEKFYNYVEWLDYMIENFFTRWECKLNGEVKWQGENMEDRGKIEVQNNVVTTTQLE